MKKSLDFVERRLNEMDIAIGFPTTASLPDYAGYYVFEDDYEVNGSGWNEIVFDNSVTWNGTSNILIQIDDINGYSEATENVACESTSYQSLYVTIDGDDPIEHYKRPCIRFGTTSGGNIYQPVTAMALDEGFKDENSGIDYMYDANGNMTEDKNKSIKIDYNYLNLPEKVYESSGTGDEILYIYDAAGVKWVKKLSSSSSLNKTLYAGGFVYNDDDGDAIDDYGARFNDPTLGRFHTIDLKVENYSFQGQYKYGLV